MSTPGRLLFWMVLGLGAVAGLAYLLWPEIYRAFLHNPALNSGIFVVLFIGIIYIFWQVIRLYREIAWIERLKRNEPERPNREALKAVPMPAKGRCSPCFSWPNSEITSPVPETVMAPIASATPLMVPSRPQKVPSRPRKTMRPMK